MRLSLLLPALLSLLHLTSSGQKIDYSIPAGYEKDISKEDYRTIVDLSVRAIAKRYTIDQVKDGTVQLTKGQDMQAFNLHNLILQCAAVPDRAQWDEIIQEHFANIFSSTDEQKKIDPKDYASVKKYLSIRLYPKETTDRRGGVASLVARTDLEGTYTLLMLDLPGAFTPVRREMFGLWGKDSSEVFQVALTNIGKQKIEKVTKRSK